MCYNVKLQASTAELEKRFGATYNEPLEELPVYENISGFAHPRMAVVTTEDSAHIHLMEWGLVPAWVKDEKTAIEMQNLTLNARSETLFEKPSFRSILKRRCLILVNGFYEWQHRPKQKIPYYIHLKTESLFALGGLYDEWVNTNTGELYKGFSIITVPANPLMAIIHNTKKRMPLILPHAAESKWISNLTEAEIKTLLAPYPEEQMQAEPLADTIQEGTLF